MDGYKMTDNMQTSAIINAGIKILRETLGIIETEIFITTIKEESFDYTEWRSDNLFNDMTLDELVNQAAKYERDNPDLIPQNAKIIA